jgi:FkbM family methyltransferase
MNSYGFIENYQHLHEIHEKVVGVEMNRELPEQELIFKYVKRNAKVLEIGGNIGSSSIVISKILDNPKDHVVLESDPTIAQELIKNKITNNCGFHVVSAALSKTPMIQNGWNTKNINAKSKSTPLPEGWKYIPTITYEELIKQHPIKFDTLVADCEGCLHPIFESYPHILNNIKTIVIENDAEFISPDMNNSIKSFIKSKGFKSVECRDLPPVSCFFQVWKR